MKEEAGALMMDVLLEVIKSKPLVQSGVNVVLFDTP